MIPIGPQEVVHALGWLGQAFWACLWFYIPWRCYAAAETCIRRALRRRRESVNR